MVILIINNTQKIIIQTVFIWNLLMENSTLREYIPVEIMWNVYG